ncbi:MAG TPA: HAD hydrolase family protein, partial [Pyrinomonadaceae bacterium]|nr:HAD hydrolase family protein [Pyrinomonadaceae bacterium]
LHGFSHEDVMVCGDNFNDLEMLDYAGTAVVMANAAEELKQREKFFVTGTNEESGVAAAIRRFILD